MSIIVNCTIQRRPWVVWMFLLLLQRAMCFHLQKILTEELDMVVVVVVQLDQSILPSCPVQKRPHYHHQRHQQQHPPQMQNNMNRTYTIGKWIKIVV